MLICALLASLLLSCASGAKNADNKSESTTVGSITTQTPTEEAGRNYIDPGLPDADYEGYDFKVLNPDQVTYPWILCLVDADEETGETINDAIYKRNRTVEEKYNITISEIISKDYSTVMSDMLKAVKSGTDAYDVVFSAPSNALSLAQQGACVDLAEVPYLNLDNSYWDQSARRDLSVNSKNYFLPGDFGFAHYSSVLALFFNKKLVLDYELDDPYKLVRDGKWTYDAFFKMASEVSSDLDGNGEYDQHDRYGYMSLNFIINGLFLTGTGERMVEKDENDMPVFTALSNERLITAFDKLVTSIYSGNFLFDADVMGNKDHRNQDVMFPGNQALFWSELVHWSKLLRSMDSEFGILPAPKLDESQDNYYQNVYFDALCMVVPVTGYDHLERTGVILEALNAESYITTIPAYYDIMLKTKISRDDESGEMLDIMFNNRVYDLGKIYWDADTFGQANTAFKAKNPSLVSLLEKRESIMIKNIEKAMEAFQ